MMQKYKKNLIYISTPQKKSTQKMKNWIFLYFFSATYPQYFITASSIQLGINFLLLIQSFQSQKNAERNKRNISIGHFSFLFILSQPEILVDSQLKGKLGGKNFLFPFQYFFPDPSIDIDYFILNGYWLSTQSADLFELLD